MQRFFIFVRTEPGKAKKIGVELASSKIGPIKDVSSIGGKWDLLLRVEMDERRDVSTDVVDQLYRVQGIQRTETIIAYEVHDPADFAVDDDFD